MALVIVFGILITLPILKISAWWVLLIIVAGTIIYTILSITILRSCDKLGEENFFTLMKLLLKIFTRKIPNLSSNRQNRTDTNE